MSNFTIESTDEMLDQESPRIPVVAVSEAKIRLDGPDAMKTLLKYGQADLAEMLGLASHIRSGSNQ